MSVRLGLVFAISTVCSVAYADELRFNVTVLLGPQFYKSGAYGYVPSALNNSGQLVGEKENYTGGGPEGAAFLYSNGQFTLLDPNSANEYSSALTINNKGDVLGSFDFPGIEGDQGFIYSHGTFTWLGDFRTATEYIPPFPAVYPTAINDNDVVVGRADNSPGFIYQNGKLSPLTELTNYSNATPTAINDKNQIFGYFAGGQFIDVNGKVTTPGPGAITAANNNGQYAGQIPVAGGGEEGFINSGGKQMVLGFLPSEPSQIETQVVGLNNKGDIIGEFQPQNDSSSTPFFYSNGQLFELRSLLDLSKLANPDILTLSRVFSINDSDDILVYSTYGMLLLTPETSPVPEPATLLMLGVPFVGAVAWMLRCRRTARA